MTLVRIHSPKDREEAQRIRDAGGVVLGGRIEGQLAVSRAIGDRIFKYVSVDKIPKLKGDLVTAEPYTHICQLEPEDEFLIISCDGLW